MRVIDPPVHIEPVLRCLNENGYHAFLVGGCVRDAVIGRHISDWDVASSATPEEVARLFPKTFMTGVKYGTVTVLTPGSSVEVTTFRTDGEYNDGRRPDSVEFVTNLREDLSRRDFTINAMAASSAGELIDPFEGLADIRNRIIRCVGDPDLRFSEDALRMFRAFRFSAQLGFSIEPETLRAIQANADRAGLISAERIRVELEKTLMSDKPEMTSEIITAGLLNRYLSLQAVVLAGIERIALLPSEPLLRWYAFCKLLLSAGLITSPTEFLRELRLDGKTISACTTAQTITDFPDGRLEIKKLLAKHGADAVRCAAAAHDTTEPSPCVVKTDEIIGSGECFSLRNLAIAGSDLIAAGHLPGPGLGATLQMLLDHVVERPEDNTREILLETSKRGT